MTEEQRYVPGTILQDQNTMSYWLVLCPSRNCAMKYDLIANLINGQVKTLSFVDEVKPISHLEIMW